MADHVQAGIGCNRTSCCQREVIPMKRPNLTSVRVLRLLAATACVVAALTMALPARAGGIYANEFGTPEMGTAGAGAEAVAMDASTAIPFYNPAGMTRLEGHQFIVAGGLLIPTVEFQAAPETTFSGGNGGQAGGPLPIITAAYVHSFSERLKFGAALFTAAGAGLEYDPDWVGRKQSQETMIAAISLSPTLAYRVNDWFSIAGGVNIMATSLLTKVEGVLPESQITIDGTDTQVSFNLSAMFEPSDKTRVGVTYVSETEFDYAGDVEFSSIGATEPVNTSLSLAQFVRIGVYHDFNAKFAILGTLGWEDWSTLESQFVSVGTLSPATIPRNWEDTYRYGVGFHYRVGDPWLVRFGLNYDTSPTRAADRTADLPVDEQLRLGAGFQNVRGEKFSWGLEVLFADLGDAEIDSSGLLNDLVGSYASNDYFGAAFNLQWRF
jgi:long-chain fatty acid transport protein